MKARNIVKLLIGGALIGALAFVLVGCGSNSSSDAGEDNVIRVAASPVPHAEILNAVSEDLAEQGYTLEVIEYTDYILPNQATTDGEVDANYFQHVPYLEDYNAENGTDLVSVAAIHYEPLGIYAGKTPSIEALPDGAIIAIPNDPTNEARALLLLADQGLITLDDPTNLAATPNNIVDNPKNIQFQELEAAAVPSALGDVDLAVINGNYALSAGLTVDDVLAAEAADSIAAQTYANVIVTTPDKANDPKVQALVQALQSDTVRDYIETTYGGSVVAAF